MIKTLINLYRFARNSPLTRGKLFSVYSRFWKWQIASRLLNMPVVFPLANNTRLIMNKGMHGATGNYYLGLMEFADMSFVLHFLREDDFFLDIGANVGVYTVLGSGVCHARTIAIEPIAETVSTLNDNVALNQLYDRVTVLNIGLADQEGELVFTNNEDTNNHVIAKGKNETLKGSKIETKTLDSLCSDASPILIKIDVEGFEKQVLDGGCKTLDDDSDLCVVIMELNGSGRRYGIEDDDIHNLMLDKGFECYSYDPLSRRLKKLPTYGSHNTIYIRDPDIVKDRILSAPKFTVLGNKI